MEVVHFHDFIHSANMCLWIVVKLIWCRNSNVTDKYCLLSGMLQRTWGRVSENIFRTKSRMVSTKVINPSAPPHFFASFSFSWFCPWKRNLWNEKSCAFTGTVVAIAGGQLSSMTRQYLRWTLLVSWCPVTIPETVDEKSPGFRKRYLYKEPESSPALWWWKNLWQNCLAW